MNAQAETGVSRVAQLENILGEIIDTYDCSYHDDSWVLDMMDIVDRARAVLAYDEMEEADESGFLQ